MGRIGGTEAFTCLTDVVTNGYYEQDAVANSDFVHEIRWEGVRYLLMSASPGDVGKIRATIDSRMSVHPQMLTSRPNLVFAAPERGSIVLEIKAGPEAWDELPDILNDFPVRVTKHSKYVNGVLIS